MLRLLDANLNRAREGLRVLEDISRFVLNDRPLTAELRQLRLQLVVGTPGEVGLLSARDVEGDVGAGRPGGERVGLPSLVLANAKRAQEALRVLEEGASLEGWDPSPFQKARLTLYDLEKRLLGLVLRKEKRGKVSGLYLVLDRAFLGRKNEVEAARAAIKGGARVLQLRDRVGEKGDMLAVATKLRELCAREGVLFIINDHLDLALATGADGLHLGQRDLPLKEARRLLPIDSLLGLSCHSLEEAKGAEEAGADYMALGSIFPTTSKEKAVVIGVETLARVRNAVSLPIVAIGGINQENVAQVLRAGAQAVAVISAVLGPPDIEAAARGLVARMEKANG